MVHTAHHTRPVTLRLNLNAAMLKSLLIGTHPLQTVNTIKQLSIFLFCFPLKIAWMSLVQRMVQLSIKMPYYAVGRGRTTGIFKTWPECEAQVKGFPNPAFKKFSTEHEAKQFVIEKGGKVTSSVEVTSDDELSFIPDSVLNGVVEPPSTRRAGAKKPPNVGGNNKSIKRKHAEIVEHDDSERLSIKEYNGMKFMQDTEGYVHVYTDGSCIGNGKNSAVAGLGIYYGEEHPYNRSEPVSGRATNNCGEIQASTMAIELAAKAGVQKLCINTDSQFLINSVTSWMRGWKRRNWTLGSGGPVKNQIDFIALDKTMNATKLLLKWVYVKAHRGILGNERADVLAKDGAEKYKKLKVSGKR